MNFDDIIKTAITEYIKSHNEYAGAIIEFFNHIDGAGKAFNNLPLHVQNDFGQFLLNTLAAKGIIITNLFNK